jgi:hypothetical protein
MIEVRAAAAGRTRGAINSGVWCIEGSVGYCWYRPTDSLVPRRL